MKTAVTTMNTTMSTTMRTVKAKFVLLLKSMKVCISNSELLKIAERSYCNKKTTLIVNENCIYKYSLRFLLFTKVCIDAYEMWLRKIS